MTVNRCLNCGDSGVETYELLVRNNSHEEVPLCEDCHEAISEELSTDG